MAAEKNNPFSYTPLTQDVVHVKIVAEKFRQVRTELVTSLSAERARSRELEERLAQAMQAEQHATEALRRALVSAKEYALLDRLAARLRDEVQARKDEIQEVKNRSSVEADMASARIAAWERSCKEAQRAVELERRVARDQAREAREVADKDKRAVQEASTRQMEEIRQQHEESLAALRGEIQAVRDECAEEVNLAALEFEDRSTQLTDRIAVLENDNRSLSEQLSASTGHIGYLESRLSELRRGLEAEKNRLTEVSRVHETEKNHLLEVNRSLMLQQQSLTLTGAFRAPPRAPRGPRPRAPAPPPLVMVPAAPAVRFQTASAPAYPQLPLTISWKHRGGGTAAIGEEVHAVAEEALSTSVVQPSSATLDVEPPPPAKTAARRGRRRLFDGAMMLPPQPVTTSTDPVREETTQGTAAASDDIAQATTVRPVPIEVFPVPVQSEESRTSKKKSLSLKAVLTSDSAQAGTSSASFLGADSDSPIKTNRFTFKRRMFGAFVSRNDQPAAAAPSRTGRSSPSSAFERETVRCPPPDNGEDVLTTSAACEVIETSNQVLSRRLGVDVFPTLAPQTETYQEAEDDVPFITLDLDEEPALAEPQISATVDPVRNKSIVSTPVTAAPEGGSSNKTITDSLPSVQPKHVPPATLYFLSKMRRPAPKVTTLAPPPPAAPPAQQHRAKRPAGPEDRESTRQFFRRQQELQKVQEEESPLELAQAEARRLELQAQEEARLELVQEEALRLKLQAQEEEGRLELAQEEARRLELQAQMEARRLEIQAQEEAEEARRLELAQEEARRLELQAQEEARLLELAQEEARRLELQAQEEARRLELAQEEARRLELKAQEEARRLELAQEEARRLELKAQMEARRLDLAPEEARRSDQQVQPGAPDTAAARVEACHGGSQAEDSRAPGLQLEREKPDTVLWSPERVRAQPPGRDIDPGLAATQRVSPTDFPSPASIILPSQDSISICSDFSFATTCDTMTSFTSLRGHRAENREFPSELERRSDGVLATQSNALSPRGDHIEPVVPPRFDSDSSDPVPEEPKESQDGTAPPAPDPGVVDAEMEGEAVPRTTTEQADSPDSMTNAPHPLRPVYDAADRDDVTSSTTDFPPPSCLLPKLPGLSMTCSPEVEELPVVATLSAEVTRNLDPLLSSPTVCSTIAKTLTAAEDMESIQPNDSPRADGRAESGGACIPTSEASVDSISYSPLSEPRGQPTPESKDTPRSFDATLGTPERVRELEADDTGNGLTLLRESYVLGCSQAGISRSTSRTPHCSGSSGETVVLGSGSLKRPVSSPDASTGTTDTTGKGADGDPAIPKANPDRDLTPRRTGRKIKKRRLLWYGENTKDAS